MTFDNWNGISTHSLTKRLTYHPRHIWLRADISTHSLTKRLTHRKTGLRKGIYYFNSQPHEEADELAVYTIQICKNISTHSLTKRLTGRQGDIYLHYAYFNSQPHEEADINSAQKFLVQNCFFATITYIAFSVHLLFNFLRIFSS